MPNAPTADAPDVPKKSGWRFRVGFAGPPVRRLASRSPLRPVLRQAANNNHSATAAISPPPQKPSPCCRFSTDRPNEPEPFADGMTEELIDKLSKIRTFVSAPHVLVLLQGQTLAAFAWGFTITIADIAEAWR